MIQTKGEGWGCRIKVNEMLIIKRVMRN